MGSYVVMYGPQHDVRMIAPTHHPRDACFIMFQQLVRVFDMPTRIRKYTLA